MGDVHAQNLARNGLTIGDARWREAESAMERILAEFRPTRTAEIKRLQVIDYFEELLRQNFGCNVLAYGSVPLKTYLPDGDIDLTVSGVVNDDIINEIASILESEKKNRTGMFVIKDVKPINAEVKLVKCIVDNIVVDISINQIGGVFTMCFLEQVDWVIGRNHLFKESIILIKAWCYYESRTLGAHAGLISTYGLEILILYIFNVFHRSLNGPLSVLYKFLEYFSTFDWDKYCISIIGPVRISTLPRIIAERPPNSHDLLLRGEFLSYSFAVFSIPMSGGGGFPIKCLNIIDPLKNDNNVGRSVSKSSLNRIRSAFRRGAKQLSRILMDQEDNVEVELRQFFSNTLTLHSVGQKPDLLSSGAENNSDDIGISRSGPLDLTGDWNDHLLSWNFARHWCIDTPPLFPIPPAIMNGFGRCPNQMLMTRPPFGLEAPNSREIKTYFAEPCAERVLLRPYLHRNRLQNPNRAPPAELVYRPKPVSGMQNNNSGPKAQSQDHLKDKNDCLHLTKKPTIEDDVCLQDLENKGDFGRDLTAELVH